MTKEVKRTTTNANKRKKKRNADKGSYFINSEDSDSDSKYVVFVLV